MKSQRRSSGSQPTYRDKKLLREFPQLVKNRHASVNSEQQSPAPVEYSVLVRNLPLCITQNQLQREFERVIPVRKVILLSFQNTKKNHAYVHLFSCEEAKKAAGSMNGVWLGSAQIKVELSTRTAKLMASGVEEKQLSAETINLITSEKRKSASVSCSEGHLDPMDTKGTLDTSTWKSPSQYYDKGPSPVLDYEGEEFDKRCGASALSPKQQSSWDESEDWVDSDYASDEINPSAVDNTHHNLPLLVSQNLSLKDNLQEADSSSLDRLGDQQAIHPAGVHLIGSFGRGLRQLKQTCSSLDHLNDQQATHPARVNPVGSFDHGQGQLKETYSSLDHLSDQEATPPAGVHPVSGFGRGRGQLKQTFQHYLSMKGVQSSGVGYAALNEGHEQMARQNEEEDGRQTAVNTSADVTVSSGGRQEKATPALLPTLVPSVDPRSKSSFCDTTGTESEIEPEFTLKSQAESELEAESQTAMPCSFLFQLLEARCENTSQESPAFLSEKNTTSLQKKISDLEVELERLLQKNAAITRELASDDPIVDQDISPEWERVFSRYLKLHAKLVVKKEEQKSRKTGSGLEMTLTELYFAAQ